MQRTRQDLDRAGSRGPVVGKEAPQGLGDGVACVFAPRLRRRNAAVFLPLKRIWMGVPEAEGGEN